MQEKRLYRSRTDRMIWGVCGGLAKYFNIDPVLVRIIFVLLILANGLGVIVYVILAIVIPVEGSKAATPKETTRENIEEMKKTATEIGEEVRAAFATEKKTTEEKTEPDDSKRQSQNLIGIVLVLVGILILMSTLNLFWWFQWGYLWPIILVIIGLIIIINAWRKK